MEETSINFPLDEKRNYSLLSFSIRIDASIPLAELQKQIENTLSCQLVYEEFYGTDVLAGYLLGMKIALSKWRGIERKETYQLHGIADNEKLVPNEFDLNVDYIDISHAIITLLYANGAGNWRIPSKEEIIAESEYEENDEWDH